MSIFKAYDIRGIYEKEISKQDAYLIGFYLVKFLKLKKLKIAHDCRLSYEILSKYFIKGVLDAKCKVIYLGLSSTVNFYYSLFSGVKSGVVITASHNPKEYNGFKIMYKLNSFDSKNGLYELEKLVLNDKLNLKNNFKNIEIDKISLKKFLNKNKIKEENTLKKYNKFILDLYNKILTKKEIMILKKINFAVDFSSGVSSLNGNLFFKKSNLNYKLLNQTPNGNFPNHTPNPIEAKAYLKKIKLDVNFTAVFDGDGDRILFYDKNSNLIFQDYIIALLIDYFSNKNKNYVIDLRTSKILEEIAKNKKLNLNRIRVGRSFYKNFMDLNKCKFGAELSGHLFFDNFKNLDNPDIALIYILKIIGKYLLENPNKKFNFDDLIFKYKKYFKIVETNIKVKNPDFILKFLEHKYKKNIILKIDGISFDFKDYWFNIRKSNTEPVIRINFEGIKKEKTQKEFLKLVKLIK